MLDCYYTEDLQEFKHCSVAYLRAFLPYHGKLQEVLLWGYRDNFLNSGFTADELIPVAARKVSFEEIEYFAPQQYSHLKTQHVYAENHHIYPQPQLPKAPF